MATPNRTLVVTGYLMTIQVTTELLSVRKVSYSFHPITLIRDQSQLTKVTQGHSRHFFSH